MNENIEIDLNLDAGESFESLLDGSEEALYHHVTSVNIACGGHAGDDETMLRSVKLAMKFGLAIGAHPSFPDREGFGRSRISISHGDLVNSLVQQMDRLRKICESLGTSFRHVKPHGALYNVAATDVATSEALIAAIRRIDPSLAVVGLAGSLFLKWAAQAGLRPIGEAFTDRRYESDGTLRSRLLSDALIEDPKLAAEQALQIVREQRVKALDGSLIKVQAGTLCVHGDSPKALLTAREVSSVLKNAGVLLKSISLAPTSNF